MLILWMLMDDLWMLAGNLVRVMRHKKKWNHALNLADEGPAPTTQQEPIGISQNPAPQPHTSEICPIWPTASQLSLRNPLNEPCPSTTEATKNGHYPMEEFCKIGTKVFRIFAGIFINPNFLGLKDVLKSFSCKYAKLCSVL